MSKHAQSGQFFEGVYDNILQGWFKMKNTSIFPVHGLASLILMSKYAQSRQFFVGFPDNILQGWFKMKTTSIFPVRGLASLILMSKYAQSRQFFVGVFVLEDENYQHISCSRTCSLKFDFEMRRHISILKRGYIVLYMDILQKQIVSIRVLFLQYYDSHNER